MFSSRLNRRKQTLRNEMYALRRQVSPEQRDASAEMFLHQLESLPQFRQAKTILLYYPSRFELSPITVLLQYMTTKTLLLPVTHSDGLEIRIYQGEDKMQLGSFGIMEPNTPTYDGLIDLIIVPGVAFSVSHHRLGRGGGYYDRFLRNQKAFKVGACYAFQLLPSVPHAFFDEKVDCVVTPDGVF